MQTLELDCPSCGEHLELDTGFAGGVCRCSNCGTLMTVPRDAGRAEQLSAPEPDGGMSDASMPPVRSSGGSRSRPASRQGKGGKRAGRGRPGTGGSGTIQAGEYRTETGRVVHVEAPIRVPMAQSKRKKIRMVTTIVFLSVVLGVVVIAVIALLIMVNSNTGNTGDGTAGTGGGTGINGQDPAAPLPPRYDPQANPFTVDFTNIAGLPVKGKIAVIVEASKGDSAFWLGTAGEMITAGLQRKPDAATSVSFYAATDVQPVVYGDGVPKPINQLKPTELNNWFSGMTFVNNVNLDAAIKRALNLNPDVLVLVISGGSSSETAQWEKLLSGKDGLVVHAVLIDSVSPRPVQQWLGGRDKSQALSLSSRQIKDWQEESASDSGEANE